MPSGHNPRKSIFANNLQHGKSMSTRESTKEYMAVKALLQLEDIVVECDLQNL